MAVRIRLRRMGAKKRPYYRVVVADSRAARNGAYIEALGTYDPIADPVRVEVDAEKALMWLERGAQPSETVKRLFQQAGVLDQAQPSNEEPNDKEA